METKEITFTQLRQAYIVVKKLLEDKSGDSVRSLKTKIVGDLSLYGDDNYELIEEFVDNYQLDYQNFEYGNYFLSEAELFGSGAVLKSFLYLILLIPGKIIELVSFQKVNLLNALFKPQREVKDLTFGDMITWYIEKRFVLRSELKYKLNNAC